MKPIRLLAPLAGAGLVLAAAGCGGSTGVQVPTVAPAAVYQLVHVEPSGPVQAGKPVRVSFTIQQPDGQPLTRFKTGPGPHTGVHLILVRDDLAYLIHEHPPVGQATIAKTVVFPAPGPYRARRRNASQPEVSRRSRRRRRRPRRSPSSSRSAKIRSRAVLSPASRTPVEI